MDYIVRVELHNAGWDDYQALHAAMEAVGFSRTIRGDDGKLYRLPTAEYTGTSNANAEAVRSIASTAAAKTGKTSAVLVTTAGVRAWIGLAFA
jgi:hypothetical protein